MQYGSIKDFLTEARQSNNLNELQYNMYNVILKMIKILNYHHFFNCEI